MALYTGLLEKKGNILEKIIIIYAAYLGCKNSVIGGLSTAGASCVF
jgi:hypothetical protein